MRRRTFCKLGLLFLALSRSHKKRTVNVLATKSVSVCSLNDTFFGKAKDVIHGGVVRPVLDYDDGCMANAAAKLSTTTHARNSLAISSVPLK